MRSFVHRHGLAVTLGALGVAILLAGTAASLGLHEALAQRVLPAPAPAAAAPRAPGGLSLDATLDVSAPLVPLDPVRVHHAPGALRAAPLPGASVDRDLSLDKAGLGADLGLDVVAGSHRAAATSAAGDTVQTLSTRATLSPATEVAAVAAVALTLAGVLAWSSSGAKALAAKAALPLVALYAKISRAEVFDNAVRQRIFQAIREHPGRSASDLARLAAVSWGTTIYHLDVLEQTRVVSSLRKGRYRRYFENGVALDSTKDIVAVLQNHVTAGVVETLKLSPGVTQKELAAATNMTPQALHWHLARLVEVGCVRKEREGRVVRHFVSAT